MNFNDSILALIKGAEKEIKAIDDEIKKEIANIDKEWIRKLSTSVDENLKTDSVKTISDRVALAKKTRKAILSELSNSSRDTQKQLKLLDRLKYVNLAIESYENAFADKEQRKTDLEIDVAKAKKVNVITSLIDQIIEKVDAEIDSLKNDIIENSSNIARSIGDSNLDKYINQIKLLNNKIVEFSKLRKSFLKLKTYNGIIKSEKNISDLTSTLKEDYVKLVEECYDLITSNNVNMKSANRPEVETVNPEAEVSSPEVETSNPETKPVNNNENNDIQNKLNEINYYLDLARKNLNGTALNHVAKLVNALDDEDLKNDLQAEIADVNDMIIDEVNTLLNNALINLDDKFLQEAEEIINNMSVKRQKDEFLGKLNVVKAKLAESKESKEVKDAKEAIEKVRDKASADKARNAISKVNDENKKNELNNELKARIIELTNHFTTIFNMVKDNLDNNPKDITKEIMDELVTRFDNLCEDTISDIGFSKAKYGDDLRNMIFKFNALKQKEYQENKEPETDKKGKGKKIFSMLDKIIEMIPMPKIVKNLYLKRKKKQLVKSTKENNIDRVKEIESDIKDLDVINGLSLFVNRNKLAQLKPKLYKNGVNGLTDKEKGKYKNATNKISTDMLKKLTKLSDDKDVQNDKLRFKTVMGQWLELYSTMSSSSQLINGDEVWKKEDVSDYIKEFIRTGRKSKAITTEEAVVYLDEILNIDYYKENYDEFYEIPSSKRNDQKTYYDLDDSLRYFKGNSVNYIDAEGKKTTLPPVKR